MIAMFIPIKTIAWALTLFSIWLIRHQLEELMAFIMDRLYGFMISNIKL